MNNLDWRCKRAQRNAAINPMPCIPVGGAFGARFRDRGVFRRVGSRVLVWSMRQANPIAPKRWAWRALTLNQAGRYERGLGIWD